MERQELPLQPVPPQPTPLVRVKASLAALGLLSSALRKSKTLTEAEEGCQDLAAQVVDGRVPTLIAGKPVRTVLHRAFCWGLWDGWSGRGNTTSGLITAEHEHEAGSRKRIEVYQQGYEIGERLKKEEGK